MVAVLLLAACASKPPKEPLRAPEWDAIPAGVADAVCQKLQMDRFGDALVIVRVTQPLATPRSLAALYPMQRRPLQLAPVANRAIPIELESGGCVWRPIDAAQRSRFPDSAVVELSAPLLNPAAPKEAGLFARVTIADAVEWYWLTLLPRDGSWILGGISPISS